MLRKAQNDIRSLALFTIDEPIRLTALVSSGDELWHVAGSLSSPVQTMRFHAWDVWARVGAAG